MDYSASLGISFPLMGLFSSSENKKEKLFLCLELEMNH